MIKADILVKLKIKHIESSYEVSKRPGAEPVQLTKGSGFVMFKNGDEAEFDWYNFVAWGKVAELMANLCNEDQYVYVKGNLRLKKWTDKEGQLKMTPEIKVSDFDLSGFAKNKDEEPTPYD